MTDTVIEKGTVPGAAVVGGVGGVAAPTAGNMGNFAGGAAPGIDVLQSGAIGGGVLKPDQSRQFIDYIWNAMVWAREGRRVTLQANTAELNKLGLGERIIKAAKQAENTGVNQNVKFSKVELKTTKVRLDWEVSTEALEDNLEGDSLEDHIARLMAGQFAQDLEDLAINADASTVDGFHDIFGTDGFLEQYKAAVTEVTWDDEAVAPAPKTPTIETYQALVKAIPRKFRGVKSNLVFYASTDAFLETVNGLGSTGNLTSETIRESVISGAAPQTIGAPVRYRVLGLPLVEVPLLGDPGSKVILLTFPQNNIWGFQRDITVHREFVPKKDTTEYTVYARFGIAIEETNASAVAVPDTP